jgi:mannose-6-phosphate isomerase-like protein (cupin superfamily)
MSLFPVILCGDAGSRLRSLSLDMHRSPRKRVQPTPPSHDAPAGAVRQQSAPARRTGKQLPIFKIKRIDVPNASLRLQLHAHRSKCWIEVESAPSVVNGGGQIALKTKQSTYIPAGHSHRLFNTGSTGQVMIDVQSGNHLCEDDAVHFDGKYGRA